MLPLAIINQEQVMLCLQVLNARLTLSTPLSTQNGEPGRGSMNTVSFSLCASAANEEFPARVLHQILSHLQKCLNKYVPSWQQGKHTTLALLNNMALCILVYHAFDFTISPDTGVLATCLF